MAGNSTVGQTFVPSLVTIAWMEEYGLFDDLDRFFYNMGPFVVFILGLDHNRHNGH